MIGLSEDFMDNVQIGNDDLMNRMRICDTGRREMLVRGPDVLL